ncbi:MAG: hypothetical protein E7586_02470 [Ruminococcaceae bacterium]|nr:hypothetical protein [Oscillospiraceae bacterium]
MFIGFYSLANSITLFGLALSLTSCFLAAGGNFKFAVYLMFLACICDMCDGTIARNSKERTKPESFYGIQLDSLCDIVSFGVTPCFVAYSFGFKGVLDVIIYLIFVICGVTRLAYFNTLANFKPQNGKKTFKGVPIPMSVFVVTFLFMLTTFIPASVCVWLFRLGYLAVAISFVLNVTVNKPDKKKALILIAIEIIMLLVLVIAPACKTPENAVVTDAETEVSETVSDGESE